MSRNKAFIFDPTAPGTYNGVIFYRYRGTMVARSKGNTGKQAPEAIEQAKRLGKASAMSAKIRAAFSPIIADPKYRPLMNGFNKVIMEWLKTNPGTEPQDLVPALMDFSLASGTDPFASIPSPISVRRKTNELLVLSLPAFDSPNPIAPLPFNGKIRLHIVAASCNLLNPSDTRRFENIYEIAYDGRPIAAQELPIPMTIRAGYLTVVGVSVNELVRRVVGACWG